MGKTASLLMIRCHSHQSGDLGRITCPAGPGFTLLEALVSLVILGVCFGVFFQGLSQSKRISWRSERRAEACRVIHNLVQDRQILRQAIEQETLEAEVEGEEGWHFTITSRPVSIKVSEDSPEEEVPGIYWLEISVSAPHGQDKTVLAVTKWFAP